MHLILIQFINYSEVSDLWSAWVEPNRLRTGVGLFRLETYKSGFYGGLWVWRKGAESWARDNI